MHLQISHRAWIFIWTGSGYIVELYSRLSMKMCSLSQSLSHSAFSMGQVCVLQSRLWPGNEVTLDFLPAAAVHLSYSIESNDDRTSGYFVLFHFSNISLCLVLLQLRAFTSFPKIISVVLETVELVKPTWPKDSLHTWKSLSLVFSLRMLQQCVFFYDRETG